MSLPPKRTAPIELNHNDFREIGHKLIDNIADFLDSLPERKLTEGKAPSVIRKELGNEPLPTKGSDPKELMEHTTRLLFENSLYNSHPSFMGYITSSAAPLGILGDLLASTINQNVGAWLLAPMATEIELQAVRWMAEMIGYPTDCGGVIVSGGNMANINGFLVGRREMLPDDFSSKGMGEFAAKARVYASEETHTWLIKAVETAGMGRDSIVWIPTDKNRQMDIKALEKAIADDKKNGKLPLMTIATAGSVSCGVVDPIEKISEISKANNLWMHIDGAYGAFAAMLDDVPDDLHKLHLGDSVAVDPHKWLYAPLEAGCLLVKDAMKQKETFSYHPLYYKFDNAAGEETESLVDYSLQNSRGFKALKVWLTIKQVGLDGYKQMLAEDCRLMKLLFKKCKAHDELEPYNHHLSITTFRYIPKDKQLDLETLNQLNTDILTELQSGGEVFVSNAVLEDNYLLRACVVNFRTSEADIDKLIEVVVRVGRELSGKL